ncbi:MAG: manganese efflux pump [Eubacteriaceae bacterium]|jgi:putative Mn2+ efflux pump MntP|nr:manganese efflux pump [Eubacteriaceae bacterium]
MSFLELLVLSFGLSMDAFAVSICQGLAIQDKPIQHGMISGAYFGSFQALMPLIGYLLGHQFSHVISSVDHWIAFILLGIIGGNMIKESRDATACPLADYSPRGMIPLAVATSIDALVVGITLAFLHVNLVASVALIGIVTFIMCLIAVGIGYQFGSSIKSKSELLGGLILIAIGTKILIEHLLEHGF